jgi:hypothetical protein
MSASTISVRLRLFCWGTVLCNSNRDAEKKGGQGEWMMGGLEVAV